MTDTSFLCIDRIVPLELTTAAADRAVTVRPDNACGCLEAAGQPHRFWATGTTLRVRFLDEPELTDRVMGAAACWTAHANLNFRVVAEGPAEIRVTFADEGNWSAVGVDAMETAYFDPNGPTMCLSEIPRAESSARVDRIARHEFGHAIGLVHEHSSPVAGLDWDEAAVLAELGGPPNHWTAEEVHRNVFRRYAATTTNFTTFDPESIMLYAIPPRWLRSGPGHAESSVLSAADATFARTIYPHHPAAAGESGGSPGSAAAASS